MDHELFNDNDSFEQFLRESTEDFKMYPSRKIWYSLYNNLHPGRKWPSLAVCIILVSAILFMDVSNNNKINKRTQEASETPIENAFTNYFTKFEEQKATTVLLPVVVNNKKEKKNNSAEIQTFSATQDVADNYPIVYNEELQNEVTVFVKENDLTPNSITINKNLAANTSIKQTNYLFAEKLFNERIISAPKSIDVINQQSEEDSYSINLEKAKNQLLLKNNLSESLLMKAYQDDHAFYNKAFLNKFKKNASLQIYITPSIGYRAWFKNKDVKLNNNAALIAVNPNQPEDIEVNQNAAFNLEVGLALNYSLSEKMKVKMGLQFNSTSYVINAGQLFHPTQASLLLENSATGLSNLEPHTSYYSSRQAPGNEKRLFNKSTQFSLPVGVDYQIGKKKNISWYAGATIQPTYVANGEANLLSADKRNYIKRPSLMRTWNANTSIETFVSIDTKAGFSVNVGPQFRYQLLSTYNNEYNYSEKLYNIGVKLCITKGF